jgi:para-aminobenzoate synthetase/4-amino-4-deoxychorismate lyase
VDVGARFDDLVAGRALVFAHADEVISTCSGPDVVDALDRVERRCAQGRWAYGFVSYEAAPWLNPDLVTAGPTPELPLLWFAITDEPVRTPPIGPAPAPAEAYQVGPWLIEWDAGQHRDRVRRVRAHIAAGDTYQCNLTSRMHAPFRGDPLAFYADLANAQHGAYCAFLDTGRFAVLSASPELFFDRGGERITLAPMKGTAPRGRTAEEDAALATRLRSSPKERAENIMIVDLLRNDVGMIARTGSVVVSRLCTVERFDTVLQMTSRIDARVDRGRSLAEVFRALFPCGSVTGAPKPRTMELIRDLESGPRGVYCGAVGYLGPASHRARFNVAIRTVVVDTHRERASYGTGGGITWSSRPAAEYTEMLTKAAVLHRRPR